MSNRFQVQLSKYLLSKPISVRSLATGFLPSRPPPHDWSWSCWDQCLVWPSPRVDHILPPATSTPPEATNTASSTQQLCRWCLLARLLLVQHGSLGGRDTLQKWCSSIPQCLNKRPFQFCVMSLYMVTIYTPFKTFTTSNNRPNRFLRKQRLHDSIWQGSFEGLQRKVEHLVAGRHFGRLDAQLVLAKPRPRDQAVSFHREVS